MTKIKRDARAFARRVKMGSARLWVLAEGRVHDRPFYDRLLRSHERLAREYSIWLVEQIEIEGVSAGGKEFALQLFTYLDNEGLLAQTSNAGGRHIVVAVDRDLDHLSDSKVESDHLMYTQSMDVESEILMNGDLVRAAADAYSLTEADVASMLAPARDLANLLAERWKDWIVMGCAAMCCDIPTEVPFAHRSRINRQGYGEVIPEKSAELADSVNRRAVESGAEPSFEQMKVTIEGYFDRDEQWMLVKGKWLAGFVWYLVSEGLSTFPREVNVAAETLAKTSLGTLEFDGAWAEPYRRQLDALLAA